MIRCLRHSDHLGAPGDHVLEATHSRLAGADTGVQRLNGTLWEPRPNPYDPTAQRHLWHKGVGIPEDYGEPTCCERAVSPIMPHVEALNPD